MQFMLNNVSENQKPDFHIFPGKKTKNKKTLTSLHWGGAGYWNYERLHLTTMFIIIKYKYYKYYKLYKLFIFCIKFELKISNCRE